MNRRELRSAAQERTYRDVHHLEPVRVADEVIGEDDSALDSGARPS